ncbi:MAG: 4Fe-4S dicluster domain-containing protein [Desulfobacterales bacterium]|jgi:heterodisulfide reductase subunit C|nr:4Fe-4S dicluster domain-containing protein [Desulfobacterales bacterium]
MKVTAVNCAEQKDSGQPVPNPLAPIREMVSACIQCGTCTGSCPNAFAMDYTPRAMWRMVLSGETEAIFESQTFMVCSACYYCTLRCPRGLPLTDAMAALKRIAAQQDLANHRRSVRFYQAFMESIRKHGRVHETEFMARYLISMKNPVLALQFTPLGMKLMAKGKLNIGSPAKGTFRLEAIFRKARELEEPK